MPDRSFLRRLLGLEPAVPPVADQMRTDWDERARDNARHYVATSKERWSDGDFFKSGSEEIRLHVQPYLGVICGDRSPSDMRMLEIGCGAGRMTLGFSEMFGVVEAVDVSPEMVSRARAAAGERANVHFHVGTGTDLRMFADDSLDFAFSTLVFQHIPRKSIVSEYIREVHRVLRPVSIFRFQVQGYPIDEEEANTWVGVGFSEQEMTTLAREVGFEILSTAGAGTQDYWLTFRKDSRGEHKADATS